MSSAAPDVVRQNLSKATGPLMLAFGAISKEPDPAVGIPPAEAATLIQMCEQVLTKVAKTVDLNALADGWAISDPKDGYSILSYGGTPIAYAGADQKLTLAPRSKENPRIVSKETLEAVLTFIRTQAETAGSIFEAPYAEALAVQQSNSAALQANLNANISPVPDARMFGFVLGDEGWLAEKEKNAFLTGQGAVRVEAIANKPANLLSRIEDEPDPSRKKPRSEIISGSKFGRIQPGEPAELRVVQYANDLGDILTLAVGDLTADQRANSSVQARINRAQDALRALAAVAYERAPEALLDYARSPEVTADRIPNIYENVQALSPLAREANQGYRTEKNWPHSVGQSGAILAIAVKEIALEAGLDAKVIDRIDQRRVEIEGAEKQRQSAHRPWHEAWENTLGSRSAQHVLHGENKIAWLSVGLDHVRANLMFAGGKAVSTLVGVFSNDRGQQVEDRAQGWTHRMQEQADIEAAKLEQAVRGKG